MKGCAYQRLLNQTIGETSHRNLFRLSSEKQLCYEITSKLRRIPFRAGHNLMSVAVNRERIADIGIQNQRALLKNI